MTLRSDYEKERLDRLQQDALRLGMELRPWCQIYIPSDWHTVAGPSVENFPTRSKP